MRKIIDKCAILLLCCTLAGSRCGFSAVVTSFLAAVAASSVIQLNGKGKISFAAGAAYILLCFIFPSFLLFLPVILYDIIHEKRWYFCAAMAASLIINAAVSGIESIGTILLLLLVSAILQYRTSSLLTLEKEYIRTRDNSVELNMLLTEKNRHLRENQDYEIHLATLKERNRIAREIHDNVGHLLSRSILQTGALQAVSQDELVKEGLAGIGDTLNNAMTTIRKSVHDLHDESIDLKQALSDAVKPLTESGFTAKTDFDCSENLPNNIKFCFISIVKEGVSNIIRHSSGNTASIILREHPAFYQLMIEDNGSCCDNISGDGIGLSNMCERIEALGGIIQISADKSGFKIFISLKKEAG